MHIPAAYAWFALGAALANRKFALDMTDPTLGQFVRDENLVEPDLERPPNPAP